ncbi:hypothetical protein AERO8C_140121 [Aeromonas veronii]|uniref:Uncharacterized protein n=1 Tax=Aeromonas veronii TaxID=654 RepID=A0A653KV27_AERVE|nr:hypothetical protein AERO8C_140121 [Aeromonas veronii]
MSQGAKHRIEMQKDWPVQYQGEKEHQQQIGLQYSEGYTHKQLLHTGLQRSGAAKPTKTTGPA